VLEIGAALTNTRGVFLDQNGRIRSAGGDCAADRHGDRQRDDRRAGVSRQRPGAGSSLSVNDYRQGIGSTTRVVGSGELLLTGSNDYAGAWAVDSGTLRLLHADAMTSTASPIVINPGGTVKRGRSRATTTVRGASAGSCSSAGPVDWDGGVDRKRQRQRHHARRQQGPDA
jgi:autotransporter-associated beta strand protein